MPIDATRIREDLSAIARCTLSPGAGASRPTFSAPWREARDYIQKQLEAIGCHIRIDAAGNLHARPGAISWDAPAWMSGSHLDSVPHGGDFDGVVGVVVALEAMRAAPDVLKIAIPLELVIWAEEEGTTFGIGMIGSRLIAGQLDPQELEKLPNADGQTYFQAGAAHGADASKLAADQLRANTILGVIEMHIEQGATLWNDGARGGCVGAIAGRRQYRCEVTGVANHAGSTSMRDRADALAGAAEIVLAMEKLARELAHDAVITVGQIEVHPNAINVIPGRAGFSIDFRSPHTNHLAGGDRSIHAQVQQIAEARGLKCTLQVTESHPAVELDKRICAKMHEAARKLKIEPIVDICSGALHDASILASRVPTAMYFVPSRGGISHSPDEFSRLDDIAAAASVLLETVRDRRI